MSLIKVHGSNPFLGQSDPYLSMDSSISYNEGKSQIQNNYILKGVLTGCDKSSLLNAQNSLVSSFDWRNDPTIPSNIRILGVVSANSSKQLIPRSLNFDDSNYIGALGYTLTLELFTGYDADNQEDELINKTHTETTNIDEKGCVSISTNISCEPNQNLTGCGAIEAANKWISGQLGKTKLGEIARTKNLPLQNESLTINPMTSAISYSSNHGQNCNDITNAGNPHSGFQIAFCSEENLRDSNCVSGLSDTSYNGEVYKSGASEQDLVEFFNTGFINDYPNRKNLSINYNNQQDSITFSFVCLTRSGEFVYEPVNYILDDYTITKDIDHAQQIETQSVDGSLSILNNISRDKDDAINLTDQSVIGRANTHAEGEGKIDSTNITRNLEEGVLNYAVQYGDGSEGDKDRPDIQFSVNYTPVLFSFNVEGDEECQKIFKSRCPQRGAASISVTVESGTGWNYLSVAQNEVNRLKNLLGGSSNRVEDESVEYADDNTSIMISSEISFIKDAVNSGNNKLSSLL